MGFSGGGSNITKAHTHDSTVVQDGGALAANVTQFGLTNGSILFSDGSNIQELGIGSSAEVLAVSGGTPAWITNTSNPLIKVSKTFSDITALEMDIYTLPQDAALVNVYTDITTVFDISTAVTIGDASDDNGFTQAIDWTSGTGLTDATRGAFITSFKTMRSTSGTTAIKAYNFTAGGSSMGSVADGTIYNATFSTVDPPIGDGWLDFANSSGTGSDYCNANGALVPTLAMSTVGSISIWFKFDVVAIAENDTILCSFGDNNANTRFEIAFDYTGRLDLRNWVAGVEQWGMNSGTPTITAGNWFHLVITHNGTTPTLWMGELGEDMLDVTNFYASTTLTTWINSAVDILSLGRKNYNGSTGAYLNGGIAEWACWNVVLSDAEIQVLHDNNDSTPMPASTYPTGLRVYFPFNVDGVMTNDASTTSDTQGAVDFYLQVVD